MEQQDIKELQQNSNINVKKADNGTTTVFMNEEEKIRMGQVQPIVLDKRENYNPHP